MSNPISGIRPSEWNKLIDWVTTTDERLNQLEAEMKAVMKYTRALVQEKLGNPPFPDIGNGPSIG